MHTQRAISERKSFLSNLLVMFLKFDLNQGSLVKLEVNLNIVVPNLWRLLKRKLLNITK